MTYDYHGQWDKKTGHVASMYTREGDDDKTFNAVSNEPIKNIIYKLYDFQIY